MKKTILSIIAVIVLLLSMGVLCSCGMTECENCLGLGHVECPECEGSGQIESEELCVYCGGTGVEFNGIYNTMCPFCLGEGYEEGTEICPECDGTGVVKCEVCDGMGEY